MDNNIKVFVRVRPLLKREKDQNGDVESLVEIPRDSKGRINLKSVDGSTTKSYLYDEAIWSFDSVSNDLVDNRGLYKKTGPSLIDHYFGGYNVCLLAYGQTGSGKTHTMIGEKDDPGIIPNLVNDILQYRSRLVDDKVDCEVRFSYMEIYNESVRDLLYDGNEPRKWKVREHPETGPYVEGLKEYTIETYDEFLKILQRGNHLRATSATSMNATSSRSHAIINLFLKQVKFSTTEEASIGNPYLEVTSNIKLVDLAGSERFSKTNVFGQQDRIKEGTLINKSLTVLGRCINQLANVPGPKERVPYRDSVLTYLLKENLGGNSKTTMLFCVSPLDYAETNQTLEYAKRVKKIQTAAKSNKVKISEVKMDWEQVHKDDTSVIESFQNEINELTMKLKEYLINTSETERLNKMVKYLDEQLTAQKFQNKYLNSKLKKNEQEMEELYMHNQYITNLLTENAKISQIKPAQSLKEQYMSSIVDQLKSHNTEILTFLDDFCPSTLF